MSTLLRPGESGVGTAGSGYTWGRGTLILHSPSTGLYTSLLQWSSGWPPFTSPQGAFQWKTVTMPKVLVPGEYGQNDFGFERALSPIERGLGQHFQRAILHWHMSVKMNWGKPSPKVYSISFLLCFSSICFGQQMRNCKWINKKEYIKMMSACWNVWKEWKWELTPLTVQNINNH